MSRMHTESGFMFRSKIDHLCCTFPFFGNSVLVSYEVGESMVECDNHFFHRSQAREYDVSYLCYHLVTSNPLHMATLHLLE